ncbi:hypothetical protein [Dactylosporangium sp. NPDC005555]|uniref:effector-associated constant component EACC1 n=1 Tax=Dactylosporangium sp. NPDC005555 TaxID=3154889 RepID=UPI0033B59F15
MDIRVEVDDEESLRQLYRWLRDDEIYRTVRVSLTPAAPRPGEMGAALEVVNAVVSNGIALGGLLLAVVTWRGTRPRPPRVRIVRGDVTVELDGAASPEEIRRLVDTLDPPGDDEPPAPGPTQPPAPSSAPSTSPALHPAPAPAPRPAPSPAPSPVPSPTPAARPAPNPNPAPSPNPAESPSPVPAPRPAPDPSPESGPAPNLSPASNPAAEDAGPEPGTV